MTRLFSKRCLLSVAVCAALFGIACDSSDDDTVAGAQATVTAGSETSSPAPGESPSASASPDDESPLPGDNPFTPDDAVLTVAIKDPATLDPMLVGDPGSALVARQLFEGLTKWSPARGEVVPAAAQSWKVEDGGATFVFKLREGMTFHDGSPVTAGDFVFAFDRIAKRKNASDLAYVLQRVKGFSKVNQIGSTDHLEGLTAVNDGTLRIELDEPDQDFPAVLTHPGLVPLPRAAVENESEFLQQPVGNGSFQMAGRWDVGGELFLEAYDDAVESPQLDGLRLIPYPESAASWLDFIEGELDVAEVPAGQIVDAGERYGRDNYTPLMNSYSFGFNLGKKGFQNLKLREAINRAIDRQTISQVVYKGILQSPRGIVPPGMPGFKEDVCTQLCEHSKKAARKLVSKVPNKLRKVKLEYPDEKPHSEVAGLVRGDLKRAGLRVTLKAYRFKDFFKLLQDEDQSMFRLTWIAEYPSPDAYLGSLFESSSVDNHTGFESKNVDKLLTKARATEKPNKRLKLYQKAEKAILKQAPIVPLGYFRAFWATQPEVSGLRIDATGGFDAATVVLDTDTEQAGEDAEGEE
ncbi:MAG: peptide ABC transporter substrate-binding protein [Actinomycetota bacterium]|nr:peptide ABC transporter substrate-binding protein [Actinomycetota bacterium]